MSEPIKSHFFSHYWKILNLEIFSVVPKDWINVDTFFFENKTNGFNPYKKFYILNNVKVKFLEKWKVVTLNLSGTNKYKRSKYEIVFWNSK